jgi:glutathione S-transferase
VIGFPEFSQLKPSLPAGQLPVLELLEGESTTPTGMIGQSNAILRYVGTLGGSGLYPSHDPLAALKVDEALDTIEEAIKYFVFTMMGPKGVFLQEDKSFSDEEKIQIRTKLMDPNYGDKNAAFVSNHRTTRTTTSRASQ